MATLSDRPFVSQEPPIAESELRNALAWSLGLEDFYDEGNNDLSPYTVIVYGNIAPRFLTLLDK